MANLRRTKLKAKRSGCNVKEVDACISVVEVLELMATNHLKSLDSHAHVKVVSDQTQENQEELKDAVSE